MEAAIWPFPQLVSDLIGVSPVALNVIVWSVASVLGVVLTYLWSGSVVWSAIWLISVAMTGIFLGMIPLWFALMVGFAGIFAAISYSMLAGTGEVDSVAESASDEWDKYAGRLKLAYAAKFGGENPGFNDEVDIRIEIMRRLRRGFTRTIARDWLRRMEKFTEAK